MTHEQRAPQSQEVVVVVPVVLVSAVVLIAAFLVAVWRAAAAEHREGSRVPPLRGPVQRGLDDTRVRPTPREERAARSSQRGREQGGPGRG